MVDINLKELINKVLSEKKYDDLDLSIPENVEYKKAAELYDYFRINSDYLDIPHNQKVCIDHYLTLCKIGRRRLPLSDVSAVSTDTMGYMVMLETSLIEKNKNMGILEENPNGSIIIGDKSHDDWYVSYDKLRDYLDRSRREKLTIGERLEEDLQKENAGSDVGIVKLKPFYKEKNKLSGITVESSNDQMWSVEDMKKLAAELLAAAELKEKQATKK
ncbi:hypothetical protein H7U05_30335 [Priestia megaterium]|uniref:hypothetical protein n=1 Tax=Priestia megaterium TaxID=1404 RepID=UPI001C8E5B54|nr:hypothetical protein [Priestia megaterium]MBY0201505.1 hypothetical protein [Priestia megaterium]